MLTMSVFFSYRSIKEIPKFKNKATEYNQVSKIWRKKEKRYLGHRIFDWSVQFIVINNAIEVQLIEVISDYTRLAETH